MHRPLSPAQLGRWHALTLVSAVTLPAVLIHGFHPYAEDGGVYMPAVKRFLIPGLYGPEPSFVLAPARTSLFAPFVAALVRLTHIGLPWMLLILYFATIWLTLLAAWLIAARCTPSLPARTAAVTLLACWLTLPIAGTSLLFMDPYITARSFSSPLVLFALAFILHHRRGVRLLSAPALALAALFHPLMAGYGAAAVLCILAMHLATPRQRATAAILTVLAALAFATIIYSASAPETPSYQEAILSRYYWFPLRWHWYEQFGAIAPFLILIALTRRESNLNLRTTRTLAHAAILLGLIAILIALLFSRPTLATHLVARLQPLRALQLVYAVMILLLGARIGDSLLRAGTARWILFPTLAAAPMFFAAHQTYPNSNHIEAPWITPRNPWQQAFLWSRDHTPRNALFALDAHYITQGRHEDAQAFRAIAERDALPDYSKDGGEAAIAPYLAPAWAQGVAAQTNLNPTPDARRAATLKPLGVTWIILATASPTAWPCPYSNETVKVCALP